MQGGASSDNPAFLKPQTVVSLSLGISVKHHAAPGYKGGGHAHLDFCERAVFCTSQETLVSAVSYLVFYKGVVCAKTLSRSFNLNRWIFDHVSHANRCVSYTW